MRRDDSRRLRIRTSTYAVAVVLFFVSSIRAQEVSPEVQAILSKDASGISDHPLTGRYEGSVLLAQTSKAFDELVLPAGPTQGKDSPLETQKYGATVTAQGRVTRSLYVSPPDALRSS